MGWCSSQTRYFGTLFQKLFCTSLLYCRISLLLYKVNLIDVSKTILSVKCDIMQKNFGYSTPAPAFWHTLLNAFLYKPFVLWDCMTPLYRVNLMTPLYRVNLMIITKTHWVYNVMLCNIMPKNWETPPKSNKQNLNQNRHFGTLFWMLFCTIVLWDRMTPLYRVN